MKCLTRTKENEVIHLKENYSAGNDPMKVGARYKTAFKENEFEGEYYVDDGRPYLETDRGSQVVLKVGMLIEKIGEKR